MQKYKKRYYHLIVASCLALQAWLPGTAVHAEPTMSGDGSKENPFMIMTADDMDQMRNNLTAAYKLGADIDLSGFDNWEPIGVNQSRFNGSLDGNGKQITGLKISRNDIPAGLFGYTGSNAVIDNVTLKDADVAGYQMLGGIAGLNAGLIRNSSVSGTVKGNLNVGMLAGINMNKIENSHSSGTVGKPGDTSSQVGGLVGVNNSSVVHSSSDANVYGASTVGGLAGATGNGTTVQFSSASGNVTGKSWVGGLVGESASGNILDSYATGDVTANTKQAGGLVGFAQNYARIQNSYSTGRVTGPTLTGGMVGDVFQGINVTNSYYNSETSGQSDDAGKGKPRTTAQMQDQANYQGWDFTNAWMMESGSYPKFYPLNSPPTVKNSTKTVAKNKVLSFAAADFTGNYSDAEGQPLDSITIIGLPLHGSLMLDSQPVTQGQNIKATELDKLSYTPESGYAGTDSFAYKASDGKANSEAATVTIHVESKAPIAVNGSVTTKQNITVNGVLTATDEDGDELTYAIVTNGTKGSTALNGTTKEFTYTPNQGETGTDTFTFKANDGTTDSNIATVTVTINLESKAPVAINGSYTTKQNTAVNGVLTATDEDGDELTFHIVTNGTKGSTALIGETKEFTYMPNPGATGTDTFTFMANDGTSNSNVATVTIEIQPVVKPPSYYPVQSVTIDKSSLAFQVGDAPQRLKAEIYPSYATNQQLSWKSSDQAVATVDATGLVTPRAAGEATITVSTNDGGKNATSRITVVAAPKEIDHLSVSERNLWMQPNETRNIRVYVVYQDGSHEDITKNDETTYRSSLKSKVEVSEGEVTTQSGTGAVTITVTYQEKRLRIPVTISKVKVEKLTFEKTDIELAPEDSVELKVTALLSDGSVKDVSELATWSTDDDEIITLDENGKVTAIAAGSAKIRVIYGGTEAKLAIEVAGEKEAKQLKVNKRKLTLELKEEAEVTVTAYMADGSKRDVTAKTQWSSRNEQVATVKDGVITAVGPGETVIRGKYQDRVVTVRVTVTE
ncbi:tandem-95 repeat protein [Brevibacillus fluminis]|uniref:Tandem-95 repeat protein n=1 Tax=Brevibacillus fluminis TaxID=511487 RepID=A0A3M8DE44_9BACL|nr:Ig-like domain-containing protein [Brevibacillus fluminis]RNB85849.1 tandem-95 repeat protein [Brevibacillus fluminis]